MDEFMKVKVGGDISDLEKALDDGKKAVTDFSQSGLVKLKVGLTEVQDVIKKNVADLKSNEKEIIALSSAIRTQLSPATEQQKSRLTQLNLVHERLTADLHENRIAYQTLSTVTTDYNRVLSSSGTEHNKVSEALHHLTSLQDIAAHSIKSFGREILHIIPALASGAVFGLAAAGMELLTEAFLGTSEAERKAAEDNKKFKDSLEEVRAKGEATGLQLQSYVSIAKDQTQSISTRNEALKEANKILGDHGEKLTLVNIATAAVTKEIELFTQATIQQALANKYSDRIAEKLIQQNDAAKKYGEELARLNKTKKETIALGDEFDPSGKQGQNLKIGVRTDLVIQAANAYKSVRNEVDGLAVDMTKAELAAANLFGQLGTHKKGDSATKKEIETISIAVAKMERQLAIISQEELIFKTDKAKEKISEIEGTIKHLVDKFKLTVSSPLILNLETRINLINLEERIKAQVRSDRLNPIAIPLPFEITYDNSPTNEATVKRAKDQLLNQIGGGFGKQQQPNISLPNFNKFSNALDVEALQLAQHIKQLGGKIPKAWEEGINNGFGSVHLDDTKMSKGLKSIEKLTIDQLQRIQSALENTFTNLAESVGKSLGDAFSGGGDFIKNALGGVFSIMGDFLIELGKAAILTSKLFLAIKASKNNPFTGILGGIAAIAAGTVLKNIKLPGFADGVTGFGGGLAIVGERGPEIVNLPPRSDVIPNHRIGNFSNGVQVFIPEVKLRGQDLVILFNRSNERISRNG